MSKNVQHLIKFIPYFSHEGKNWEPILPSLIHQGTKPPLQSKDPALFQRDWDITREEFSFQQESKDPALFQRDWDIVSNAFLKPRTTSKDPALFQRDWDSSSFSAFLITSWVERPRPVPKGLRQAFSVKLPSSTSKDPALFQRDWDNPNFSL